MRNIGKSPVLAFFIIVGNWRFHANSMIIASVTCLMTLWLAAPLSSATRQARAGQVDQETVKLDNLSSVPLSFTQNKGQWPDSILYRANAGGATMWFTPGGAYYQFTRRVPGANGRTTGSNPMADPMQLLADEHEHDSIETMMIKASFVGCNPNLQLAGDNLLEYKCNYFHGNDQSKWRIDVPNYSSVTYKEVYEGIDLKYYGDGHQMEYDFVVAPGADYSQIRINYEGAKSLAVNDKGDLVIETGWGTVTEKSPIVYQMDAARRTAIPGAYRIVDSNTFGFSLGEEYNWSLPVVIDPVISYSSYLGGSGLDWGRGIAVDLAGSAYITGYTGSSNFPIATPFTGVLHGNYDAFVTKVGPGGGNLLFSTYLGGSGYEQGCSIAVDEAGCAYVTGITESSDFPTAVPFVGTLSGSSDAFVTKLSPNGNGLAYSTYLGGSSDDNGFGVAVDSAQCAYVTGLTYSSDFPTVAALDGSWNGGQDAFVTKLSPSGGNLVYSTYLGGSSDDVGSGIAVDRTGSAYVTGHTFSTNFPTAVPLKGSANGGVDAFVTKLSPSGNSLVYSTYLGGNSFDSGFGIAVDMSGSAYVTGSTMSSNFPTALPIEGSLSGTVDAFVTKLSWAGNSLVYSSYLGGSGVEEGYSITVDRTGNAYVTGYTTSSDFPIVAPFEAGFGGVYDVFVTKLNPFGNSLVYSSYLGGGSYDRGYGIAVDVLGSAFITGETESFDFPTAAPFASGFSGSSDAFVTKVSSPCCTAATTGDVDASGSIDIADLTAMVDYIFSSVPFPGTCFLEQDVDKSGSIDITDLQGIIDYLFSGAALPNCP